MPARKGSAAALGAIPRRAAFRPQPEPVDLVDDHDIDPPGPDIGEQALQRWPLDIATREPAVVVAGSGQYPAFVALAADEGLASFALRGKRVELLLEPFFGGFAGVDRTSLAGRVRPRHCRPPSAGRLGPVLARTGGWRAGSASSRRR